MKHGGQWRTEDGVSKGGWGVELEGEGGGGGGAVTGVGLYASLS